MQAAAGASESLIERAGLAYLARLSRGLPPAVAADAVHVLDEREQEELRRIEREAVGRAALAGALSALVAATAEAVAEILVDPGSHRVVFGAPLAVWLWSIGFAAAAAVLEIAFVYRDALRAVHALARAAGVDPPGAGAIGRALVRAALELPNEPGPALGVDPRREASRARLVAASLAYKLKVALTSVLFKALARRALGRATVRVALPYVAVPVSAAWNAVVAWRVLREARIRVMGPSYVEATVAGRLGAAEPAAVLETAQRAVASAIVRTCDLHPNLVALLVAVHERAGADWPADLDDTRRFLAALEALDGAGRESVLAMLATAAVVDGRLTRAEARLWREALAACGRPDDVARLERMRRAFVAGRPELPPPAPQRNSAGSASSST
ncbi:MAG: hypothetical protein NDJ94_15415 [Vicinamibacteria bacterium]|nr:hypothetical protein [Vicinamibacteria bacterium]